MYRSLPDIEVRKLIAIILSLAVTSGCQQEMENQPRVETYERAAFFPGSTGARMQVPGTVARGQTWLETSESSGKQGREYISSPLPVTRELLIRGQQQFDINCEHCHGLAGYGDGMVVQRGFPKPPSYHIDRLREVPDGRLFEVISQGHGRMPAFENLISVDDRWSIVAFVRTLQLSQNVKESELSEAEREHLTASTAEEGTAH